MVHVEGKPVIIDRPVEAVWKFMTDPSNVSKFVDEEVDYGSEPLGLGSTFQVRGRFLGRQVAYDIRVAELEQNKKFTVEWTNGFLKGVKESFMMESLEGDKTRLVHVADLRASGLLRVLAPLIAWRYRGSLNQDVGKVKRFMEGGS